MACPEGMRGGVRVLNRTSYFLVIGIFLGVLGAAGILGPASPMTWIFCVLFLAFFAISYLYERKPPVI